MFQITYGGLSLNEELQIVQADVFVEVEGETLADEPLCIDAGLPALLRSAFEDTRPDRFADPVDRWEMMPFFVCGCGDPECRGFTFAVSHDADHVIWTEMDQSPKHERTIGEYRIPKPLYRKTLLRLGKQFLAFVQPLPYRPLLANTVSLVKEWTDRLGEEESRLDHREGPT